MNELKAGVESPKDLGTPVARWITEIKGAERAKQRWRDEANRIVRRYMLENDDGDSRYVSTEGEFNILHSNISTLLPAVFGQTPIPVVCRRNRDQDQVGRIASEVLQRCLTYELDEGAFGHAMGQVALDLLLVGQGVSWVRFEPEFGGKEGIFMLDAKTPVDYVNWSDWLCAPRATWEEVAKDGWVARRVSMTRAQGLKRFGDVFEKVPLDAVRQGAGGDADSLDENVLNVIGRSNVWEVWDKDSGKVFWLNTSYADGLLDEKKDPLGLTRFFPCPMPAYGTLSNRSLVPTPDFRQYEKLAEELSDLTAQIATLTQAIRVIGIYDASMQNLASVLEDSSRVNKMIPVDNPAILQGRGIDQALQFFPVERVIQALIGLYDARDRTKDTLYEVSGISDIARGVVDHREKLGQSRLKSSSTNQRLQKRVEMMAEHARDVLELKGEIIAEHYAPELIRRMSGFDMMQDVRLVTGGDAVAMGELFQNVVGLLKSEKARGFRVNIETNSTMMADDDEEKARRSEFVSSMAQFIEHATPMAQAFPATAPLLGELMMFAVRAFKGGGRELEDAFQQTVDMMKAEQQDGGQQEAQQQQQAMEAQQQQQQMEQQMAAQEEAGKQQMAQMKLVEASTKAQAAQAKAEVDMQKTQIDAAVQLEEFRVKLEELEVERARIAADIKIERTRSLTEASKPR